MDDIGEAVFYRHILPERLWKLQRWLRIGKEKKLAEASKIFNEILSNYISVKRELSSKEASDKELGGENFDVLKFYLLQAGNGGSIEHVNKALIANLMTLFFAGRDTSGALLTWFFWLISKNPLVENKIVEEMKQNLAENASQKHFFSNVQELGKLVYLHSTLCEALRLFPTGPFLLRVMTPEVCPLSELVKIAGGCCRVDACDFFTVGATGILWSRLQDARSEMGLVERAVELNGYRIFGFGEMNVQFQF